MVNKRKVNNLQKIFLKSKINMKGQYRCIWRAFWSLQQGTSSNSQQRYKN